jgi:hypothetical protein
LRELTPQSLDADAQLFPPRPAYRFRAITSEAGSPEDPTVGQNTPYGASINYYLKTAPTGNVSITISDPKGQVVRTLAGPRAAGVNRVYWNLRDAPSKGVALRTSPLYAPQVRLNPDGTRDSGGGRMTILEPPGTYTVKLSVGGRDYTQQLTVRKDPHSAGTEADIAAQQRMLLDLRRDLDATVDAINGAELVRSQVYNLMKIVDDTELKQAADELEKKMIAVEGNLIELRATGRGQDGVRWGSKLVQKLGYQGNGLASGDFKPTNQQIAVHRELQDRLKTWQGQLGDVLSRDLAAFNDMLRRKNLPSVVAQVPRRPTFH